MRKGHRLILWLALFVPEAFGSPVSEHPFTVVSLNMQLNGQLDELEDENEALSVLRQADLLLLQEVAENDGESASPRDLANLLGLPYCFSPSRRDEDDLISPRLAILSRYPMRSQRIHDLDVIDLVIKSRQRYVLDAVVETPGGDLRVFNLHLDSRINFSDRLLQLENVLLELSDENGPVMIGGDFNSNDFFWLFHLVPIPFVSQQQEKLVESLAAYRLETPFLSTGPTHDSLRLKLDWIFGRDVSWLGTGIIPVKLSDHHLIWARFQLIGDSSELEYTKRGRTSDHSDGVMVVQE